MVETRDNLYGEKTTMAKRIWTEEQIRDIISLYTEQGKTLKEIGVTYKAKGDTISKLLKANNVEIGKKGASKNRLLDHQYFSMIDSEAKAYFLGLLAADGSIVLGTEGRSPYIGIELIETDKKILDLLKEELRLTSDHYYNKRKDRENGTYSLSFRSGKIANDLKKYGLVPNKTYEMDSIDLELVPKELHSHFLRGFIDGDGSIYESSGSWHLSITGYSYAIIEQIKDLGLTLAKIQESGKITKYNNVHKYTYNGAKAKALIEVLYQDCHFFIERKREKALQAIS